MALKPRGSLTVRRQTVRPTSSEVSPGGSRDLYARGQQVYQLLLEYKFEMKEDGDVKPHTLLLNDKLYESMFESQLLMIFDHHKCLKKCGDVWPTKMKLKKGSYTARLQVRALDTAALEQLKGLPLALDFSLDKPVAITAHTSFNKAVSGTADFGAKTVRAGVSIHPVQYAQSPLQSLSAE